MHEACPVCGEFYEKEIGHFWAAMYVSYMFNVAFLVASIIAINVFDINWSIPIKTSIILGVLIVLSPLNFRHSRVFSLYLISGIKLDKKYIS